MQRWKQRSLQMQTKRECELHSSDQCSGGYDEVRLTVSGPPSPPTPSAASSAAEAAAPAAMATARGSSGQTTAVLQLQSTACSPADMQRGSAGSASGSGETGSVKGNSAKHGSSKEATVERAMQTAGATIEKAMQTEGATVEKAMQTVRAEGPVAQGQQMVQECLQMEQESLRIAKEVLRIEQEGVARDARNKEMKQHGVRGR